MRLNGTPAGIVSAMLTSSAGPPDMLPSAAYGRTIWRSTVGDSSYFGRPSTDPAIQPQKSQGVSK